MAETTRLSPKANPSRRRRLLRLPSFSVALAISLATLLAFAVWMLVDAAFPLTLEVIRIGLRLEGDAEADLSGLLAWDALGPRLLVFGVLTFVAVTSTVIVFYRTLFGGRNSRTLSAMFIAGRSLESG